MSTATGARYSWGADEHLFVEVSEEMSLPAYFKAMAIVTALREDTPDGVLDVCPANAAYQVRFDPEALDPHALETRLRELEERVGDEGLQTLTGDEIADRVAALQRVTRFDAAPVPLRA